jgi:hypothetical protein
VAAGAGWRLQGGSAYLTNGAKLTIPTGEVHIEFKPVNGYITPPTRTLTLTANQEFTLPVNYTSGISAGPARFTHVALVGQTLNLGARRVAAGPVVVESSSDIVHWESLRTIDLAPDTDTDFQISLTSDQAGFLRLRNP